MTESPAIAPAAPPLAGAVEGAVARAVAPWAGADLQSLPAADLLALGSDAGAARRRIDGLLAAISAEMERRSTQDDGAAGLARRLGYRSPREFVAAATGGSGAEAGRLMRVGSLLVDDAAAVAVRPFGKAVADAVKGGSVSIDKADAIGSMLNRVHSGGAAADEELLHAEQHMVERAPQMTLDQVAALARRWEARLDAAALERKEARDRDARYLHMHEQRNGMFRIEGLLDVATAAPVKQALDNLVAEGLRTQRDLPSRGTDGESGAARPEQMRADALALIANHQLGCNEVTGTLPTTTMVVRVAEADARAGTGTAEVDGIDQPVSIATANRLAGDATVVRATKSCDGEILDWGRERRLFTRPQKLALVERDGGCARCHAPPSWCDAHHIRWWDRDAGPTDLANGILLCARCHHDVHRDGWGLKVEGQQVWFVPPRSVDPARRPRPGSRAWFDVPAAA